MILDKRTFVDRASGATAERPQLKAALDYLRAGDTLVVWKLDRLGRSLRHLLDVVADLERRAVGFRSLQDAIDITTPAGRLMFHVLASLAEFERDLIRERTHAGLTSARSRGRVGGRPSVLTGRKLRLAREMRDAGDQVTMIAATLGVSRATLYRGLDRALNTDADPQDTAPA